METVDNVSLDRRERFQMSGSGLFLGRYEESTRRDSYARLTSTDRDH